MTAPATGRRKYTVEEYVELLLNSEERFEYFDGEVLSMASGTLIHSEIESNLGRHIGNLLAERPCRVMSGSAAIKTVKALPFRMADVSVVCGEKQTEEYRGIQMLLNPVFICEILSPKTERYDRDDKFIAYQAIESFQEYLLVEQDRPHVIRYRRQPDNRWVRNDVIGLENSVELESLGITVALSEIYRMIEFPVAENSDDEALS
ncbi:MAG: Uma2 family endonuclease [Acidobacteria bacterium]|nr:Uma2 family endonuclease [Acidobacteriota bacterium]